MIKGVIQDARTFDDVKIELYATDAGKSLSVRDRAFARLLTTCVLRDKNALESVLSQFIDKPLPKRQSHAQAILLMAAAQLLILKSPPHAAINSAINQIRQDRKSTHLAGFANAVLRRVATDGITHFDSLDRTRMAVPDWIWQRWAKAYGADIAYRIAAASLREPALDLTVKSDPKEWAQRLGANLLRTGSLRVLSSGAIEDLAGYKDGCWWVQDAAAALPARLLGNINAARVLDLCAAPGGKTAQLAAAGAKVTAVDKDETRCARIRQNLDRLHLSANIITADATQWTSPELFDAVLLDAPCSATGTIRRHPDILHLRRKADIPRLAELQARLLKKALEHLRPGGRLVFATCSLEPEEGEDRIRAFLNDEPWAQLDPITTTEADAIGLAKDWLTAEGLLRTLPFHDPRTVADQRQDQGHGGMDGFFAARFHRLS